ncbi:MAG: hotdog fold domain-containing protein, partial [Pseudomonadota bacterium]
DTAWGHVVDAGEENWWVTVRLTCDFLSSAALGDWVEATGEIIGVQGDLYTVRGRTWCGDRMIMTGTGTFKVLPRKS